MDSLKNRAERVWMKIASNNLGAITGPAAIEQELRKAVMEQKTVIIKELEETNWSYSRISIGFHVGCVWNLLWRPRVFFCTYFKSIQIALVDKIRRG
jgi:hypothetical protein